MGRTIQSNDQQPAKRVFIVKTEESRTRGRPCSRWADNIDMDIRSIGECNWKAIAVNRENLESLLRMAMAHERDCHAKDDDDDDINRKET
jgi:hypothetical protein